MFQEYAKGSYLISTDPQRLDVKAIHHYLAIESYWAKNIPIAIVEKAIQNSLCFGLYMEKDQQIGLARVITDYATFAYLCDVYIIPEHQGKGLSKWLMACILAHPDLQSLRRFMLLTKDAHGLYAQFGFSLLEDASQCMAKRNPGIYNSL